MTFTPTINNDTMISVLMAASDIPDKSVVTKKTGAVTYILRDKLVVYQDTKGEKPIEIEGTFLLNERGDITKIKESTILCWNMRAEDFYEWLVAQQIGDENYVEDK